MQKLKNIVVIDGDEVGSFISKRIFKDLNLPYNITYLSGMLEGLDYLKQVYPKGTEAAEGQDLLLLGMT